MSNHMRLIDQLKITINFMLRKQPQGNKVDHSADAFWRSFLALLYSLPGQAVIFMALVKLMTSDFFTELVPGREVLDPVTLNLNFFIANIGMFAGNWLIFIIALVLVLFIIDAKPKYTPLVINLNWGNFLFTMMFVGVDTIYLLDIIFAPAYVFIRMLMAIAVFVFRINIIYSILRQGYPIAITIVIFELVFSLFFIELVFKAFG